MAIPFPPLGALTVDRFLSQYWQKKPVLIRGLFGNWTCPISPEELLALAAREDADSRLILTGSEPVELYHGPFEDGELGDLPETEWTVLVQEVDRLDPRVAELLGWFRFLPNWRLDDIMVSYAAPGGGVGAHTDRYDVFLVQGHGRRRWEIETTPRHDPVWREDSEVAQLASFHPDESWVLEPGDVLYLPPMIPHNGVALEPCLTLSVGCRAPSTSEMLSGILAYVAEEGSDEDRHTDPDLEPDGDPGRIRPEVLASLRSRIRSAMADDEALDRWIARYVTEPVRGHSGPPPRRWIPPATIRRRLEAGAVLVPSVRSQVAWVDHAEAGITLYASGQAYAVLSGGPALAALLAGSEPIDAARAAGPMNDPVQSELITSLVNAGVLALRGA